MNYVLFDIGLPIYTEVYNNEPIGGSEFSLLLHGEKLAKENPNSQIYICSNIQDHIDNNYKNLHFINYNKIVELINFGDIFIFNRVIPNLDLIKLLKQLNKKVYIYAHDAYDQNNVILYMNKELLENIDKIYCVSNWQLNTYNRYLNIPLDKLEVKPNLCLKEEWLLGHDKKIYDFIFASIPYKGLYVMPEIIDAIINKTKNLDLKFAIVSDYKLYKQENDNEYYMAINKLRNIKNVDILDIRPPVDLIKLLKQSRFYIHPSTYHETFGIVLVQAQASQCIPICVNNGAVSEIIEHNKTGFLTKGKTIYHRETFNEFVDLCVNALNLDKNKIINIYDNMYQNAKKYTI